MLTGTDVWKRGKFIDYSDYTKLMDLLFAHFIVAAPPRRLEYADTRLITPEDFDALGPEKNDFNFVVMHPGRARWMWHMFAYRPRSTQVRWSYPSPLP